MFDSIVRAVFVTALGLFNTPAGPVVLDPECFFTEGGANLRKGGDHDSYWRLPDYSRLAKQQLRAMGAKYQLEASSSAIRNHSIADRLKRLARGDLNYHKLNAQDLVIVAEQRGIFLPSYFTKEALIDKLFATDDVRRFIRLLDLPSEIRIKIYEHYCDGFESGALYAPAQPPLARTSRQMRQEVLPVFYKECVFAIHLTYPLPKCRLATMTSLFFNSLDPVQLALIRKLQICICQREDPYFEDMTCTPIAVEIKIALTGKRYELHVDEAVAEVLQVAMDDQDLDDEDEEAEKDRLKLSRQVMEQGIRPAMDRIIGRADSRGKLCLTDIYRFGWMVQETWEKARRSPYKLFDRDDLDYL